MVQARRCGGEEMLTHKSIIGNCPDCKGVGKLPIVNPFYLCPTCHGTGHGKVVWTEPIENIRDGYEFDVIIGSDAEFKKPFRDYFNYCQFKLPYKIGDTITVICDACGGKSPYGIAVKDRSTELIDELFGLCPVCKGKPELKVKVTKIEVVNNEFIMEGDLLC